MQVTETLKDGLKRAYAITVTAAELDQKVDGKLAEARPEIALRGFRKGKVPLPLLKKQFGQKLLEEAIQETVNAAMAGHFETSGDRPAMQPDVSMANRNWRPGDPLEMTMTYEALPQIPEIDLASIRLERLVATPGQADVDKALEGLAASAGTFTPKDGAADEGDQVVIDFAGKIDGTPFDGGTGQDFPLTLGAGQFIPGFEPQLVGAQAGEDRTVSVTVPADYKAAHLAGKTAAFDCTVKQVNQRTPADMDDALAQRFEATDVADLRAKIAERLTREYTALSRHIVKRNLLDALDTMVDFELPPSLVDSDARQIAHRIWREENPDVEGHDHPPVTPTQAQTELARRRVRLGLFMAELGRKNQIEVSESETAQAVMAHARQYTGQELQFVEFIRKNAPARQQIQAPIFEDKVADYILELASVEEREVSREELQKAFEALEDAAV